MSGPRSLRAAFEACQPLRKYSAQKPVYRSFSILRNPLLAETSPSSSEIEPNPNDHQQPFERPAKRPIVKSVVDKQPHSSSSSPPSRTSKSKDDSPIRNPRSVQASYLRPLRRAPIYGQPVCDLQLRSYSVRNVEFMADFAMRAAYYLRLPARGPTPLPKIRQRWTVIKSNFVHKKSQENFERITLRRLIQIQDGDAEVVKIWLAYLRRYAFWGVGMKANVWEYEGLDVAQNMDQAYTDIEKELEEKLSSFGFRSNAANRIRNPKSVPEWLRSQDNRLPGEPMMELRSDSWLTDGFQPHKTESVY